MRGNTNAWLGLAGIATMLALCEIVPRLGLINPAYLPPLSMTLNAMFTQMLPSGEFWQGLGNTLVTMFIGLAVVICSGMVLGVAVGRIGILRNLTATTVEFLRPIPAVAFIPLVVSLFGIDRAATVSLVIYASFWQLFVQVQYGVRDVDPVARDTARVYRFRQATIVRKLTWPTVLPYAMTGFRLSASVALILTITGELIIGTEGLGRLIVTAQNSVNYPQMYALIIVTGMLGLLVNIVARAMERRLLRWHPSVRLEAAS
jgi:ABC-type nitrate/sulfonate/bicarbonate transport system permease component